MRLISLSSRLIRIRCIVSARYSSSAVKIEKPELRFSGAKKLPAAKLEEDADEDSPSPMGYVLIGIPIITFILGTWQVRRRQWKLDLIEDLNKRTQTQPVTLPEDLDLIQDMEYKPVKVKGEFLYDKEMVLGPKSLILDGAPASEKLGGGLIGGSSKKYTGFNVITPFKVEGRNQIILVNRGWVKQKLENMPKDKLGYVPGVLEITGLVRLTEERQPFMAKNRLSENSWLYRDINALARKLDTDPVFIDLLAESGAPNGPIAGQTRVDLRNEHLAYIFTWYSLSVLTSWMWYRQILKGLPPW